MKNINHISHLVVEGPIGVGKTSLAKRLAESFNGELLLEGAHENPFLPRYYQDPKSGALPAQLFFLMQRAQQMQDLRQSDMFSTVRVADFIMEKDRLFAQITLDEHELKLYEQVYETLTFEVPRPDLVIYLQAPADVLLSRIRKRGINHERLIDAAYLERINRSYAEFFYHYDQSPLLIINAANIDLVNADHDYNQLLEHIVSIRSGRHYFNPMPIAL